MSDISLTASMRSNLLSLQNTSDLMDRTQERLSTGKKVNSALDNPGSYYTARSLDNRAGDLNSLLDSMGQGISTVKAANEGIESITSFVEQAKAVANSAREQPAREVSSTGTYGTNTKKTTYAFEVPNGPSVNFTSDKTGDALAAELKNHVKTLDAVKFANVEVTYSDTTGKITLDVDGSNATTNDIVTLDGYSYKIEVDGISNPIYLDTSALTSADDIMTAIHDVLVPAGGLKDDENNTIEGITVAINNGNIIVNSEKAAQVKITGSDQGLTMDGTAGSSARISYMEQYNDLLDQVTALAKDASYKGINLLQKDDLTVTFNEDRTSKLVIEGVDASAQGLGLTKVENWGENESIEDSINQIDNAISKLRNMSSQFGNNYSILQTREDFTENLVNVLEEGSDKLTLADMNEESANMLALQTRQQLAVNSLNLASQSAQAVLKLFS